jgi:hypothetical protein
MSGIVEGRRWVEARRHHLQGLLEGELADDQRQAVEAELAGLQAEAARHHGWRWWLRLVGGRGSDL